VKTDEIRDLYVTGQGQNVYYDITLRFISHHKLGLGLRTVPENLHAVQQDREEESSRILFLLYCITVSFQHISSYKKMLVNKQANYFQVPIPNLILMYNANVGSVDLLDSSVANYRISFRMKKW
jgi:hypothetical protein